MATNVNLNVGGIPDPGNNQVVSCDLVLRNDYVEPDPLLLVLRSAPDIEGITGGFSVVAGADTATGSGSSSPRVDPISGTLRVNARNDSGTFSGAANYPVIIGEFSVTGAIDTTAWVADNKGLVPRLGHITAVEADDTAAFSGDYKHKTTGVFSATERADTAYGRGAFYQYEGPGALVVDGVPDIAVFAGTNVYDASGVISSTGRADTTTWVVNTGITVEATPVIDTITITELLIGQISGDNLVSRSFVTDILDFSRDIEFSDSLVGSEDLVSGLQVSLHTTDVINIADNLYALAFDTTQDTVQISDSLEAVYSAVTLIDEVLASDFAASSNGRFSGGLVSQSIITDTVLLTRLAVSADRVLVIDTLYSPYKQNIEFTETVQATETLTSPLSVYAQSLGNTVVVSDELISGLTLVGVLADTALAGDSLYDEAQTILIINAETGAVSTYVFTPMIHGMASYQGTLYLAGPDGLYAMDATEDEEGSIIWSLRTGFSNLGIDKIKRVQDANFQAHTDGDTVFQVVSDRYGTKQEWNYRLPPLTRDSYRDGIVKVGRGVQSVYWQFAAQGVGPAEIDQMRLAVEPLSRRR